MSEIISSLEANYIVTKPWGNETWIATGGQRWPYVLKRIFLTAGTRSSLQFHLEKQETNWVLDGTGTLEYSSYLGDVETYTEEQKQDEAARASGNLQVTDLGPGVTFHMEPGRLHRVYAITDLVMVEVSTDHLDDVIRLGDDAARGDGRISSEHGRSSTD